jgi:hypothetical protein
MDPVLTAWFSLLWSRHRVGVCVPVCSDPDVFVRFPKSGDGVVRLD